MAEKCWEYCECKVKDDCPAYLNSGKDCYSTRETLCRGEAVVVNFNKVDRCRNCDFYNEVVWKK